MERKVKLQNFIDALGMANLLVSINGESPCDAIMSLYTEPEAQVLGAKEICSVTYNSKEVKDGTLFVCKGAHFKEEYLADAISRGAICYVREAIGVESSCSIDGHKTVSIKDDCIAIFVNDIRAAMPIIAKTYYGDLSAQLKVVGVTGTKGKSTTAYYMRYILDDYMAGAGGRRSAICSGIDNYDGVIEEESHLTSPEVMELYKHMDNAISSGIEYMTMEVSSQALKYDRVEGVTLEAGAFLNIGTDHISDIEHPNFEDYFESKLKIFKNCRKACYSLDSESVDRIQAASHDCTCVITFSQIDSAANVYAYDVKSEDGRVSFRAAAKNLSGYEDFDEAFELGTFGTINVENALAAISLSALLEVPLEYIKSGLAKAQSPGRMEVCRSKDGKRIAIVDYAHNKLSYERFFETIKDEFPGRKIIIVFGSAGGKAFSRREELGTIAGLNCEYSIITEEDYGEEDLMKICTEIAGFVEAAGGKAEIILDRGEAIKKAISLMDDDTIVFIPGKGRETRMKRGTEYIDTPSDMDYVEMYL